MAVTLRELFAAANDQLVHPSENTRDTALAAVATFTHVARGLDHLYEHRPYEKHPPEKHPPVQHPAEQHPNEQHPNEVRVLAVASYAAARCWPQAAGHVADLLGVAADAVATRARSFDDRQRWAVSLAFAETARRAVDTARRFPPFARIPHLDGVRDAAVACEQRAARAPGDVDPAALDRLIPAHLGSDDAGLNAVVDAAAAVHVAITASPQTRMRLAELMITINAAQLATASYAAHLPPIPGSHPWHRPALAAPDAWHAARLHCRPFDDASKLRPPSESAIAAAAARLGRSLIDQFGPAPTPGAPASQDATSDPARAGALLTVTALLPDVAARLQSAAHAFSISRQLWANGRSLLAYEDRDHLPGEQTAIAVPEYRDLERLVGALHHAGTLTTALASDLGSIVPARLPDLTRAHAMTSRTAEDLNPLAMTAHNELRHAHLVATEEWAAPATPKPRARSAGR